jgi:hypothetical protein
VLEHVNYFHIQLMHDTSNDVRRLLRRGFRRSSLARNLDQAARLTRAGKPTDSRPLLRLDRTLHASKPARL